jgi:hypothetical protein
MVVFLWKNGCKCQLDLIFGPILVLVPLTWKLYYLVQDFILFMFQSLGLRDESKQC